MIKKTRCEPGQVSGEEQHLQLLALELLAAREELVRPGDVARGTDNLVHEVLWLIDSATACSSGTCSRTEWRARLPTHPP